MQMVVSLSINNVSFNIAMVSLILILKVPWQVQHNIHLFRSLNFDCSMDSWNLTHGTLIWHMLSFLRKELKDTPELCVYCMYIACNYVYKFIFGQNQVPHCGTTCSVPKIWRFSTNLLNISLLFLFKVITNKFIMNFVIIACMLRNVDHTRLGQTHFAGLHSFYCHSTLQLPTELSQCSVYITKR